MKLLQRAVASMLISALVLALAPAVALAASRTDMWEHGAANITDLEVNKTPTFAVTLQLKKSVKLPVKVTIPVPKGCAPLWAGEVFFGDAANDIFADDIKLTTKGDTTYATFTMRQSRAARIECSVAPDMVTGEQSSRTVDLYWRAPPLSGTAQTSILAPDGFAAAQTPEGVEVLPAAQGTTYVRTDKKVKAGKTLRLKLDLVVGDPVFAPKASDESSSSAASSTAEPTSVAPATTTAPLTPPQPASTGGSSLQTAILIGASALLAAAVAALVVMVRKQRTS